VTSREWYALLVRRGCLIRTVGKGDRMTKKELLERIDALEQRVAALEARPYMLPYYPQVPWGVPTITYGDGTAGKPLPSGATITCGPA
jgi:hypothetical protein